MNLIYSHEQAIKWMEKSIDILDGQSFEPMLNGRVAVSLLHLSMEHNKAICVLVGTGQTNGSVLALLRPQFEALVRGLWVGRCAPNEQVNLFISGKEPPRINELILAIQCTDGYKNGALMRYKDSLWKALNDYTHAGAVQVKARNTDTEIKCSYRDEHIVWLLEKSSVLSLLAGIEMSRVADDDSLARELITTFELIYAGNDDLEELL